MRRLLMNFQDCNGWTYHFIESGCVTPVVRYIDFASFGALRAFYLRNPEDVTDFDHCIRTWGKGSAWVNLTDEQYVTLKDKPAIGECRPTST
jgi:hypothetical protein